MNAREELKKLERERDLELRSATREFSRLKRDARRAVSPGRAIRKHIPAALGLAMLAGILMAPAPRYVRDKNGPGRRGGLLQRLLHLLAKFVPQLRGLVSEGEHPEPAPASAAASPAEGAKPQMGPMAALLHRLVAEVNWPALLTLLIAQWSARMVQPETEHVVVEQHTGDAESRRGEGDKEHEVEMTDEGRIH